MLANGLGLIDVDYRGQILCRFKYQWQPEDMMLVSMGEQTKSVGNININRIYKKGDTIAQLVIGQTIQAEWEIVDELTQTQRGQGGFGSTDEIKISPKPETPRTSISDIYNKTVNVVLSEKYTELVKRRDQ